MLWTVLAVEPVHCIALSDSQDARIHIVLSTGPDSHSELHAVCCLGAERSEDNGQNTVSVAVDALAERQASQKGFVLFMRFSWRSQGIPEAHVVLSEDGLPASHAFSGTGMNGMLTLFVYRRSMMVGEA